MKRRHQTQITVWPAITDLMTSIVVVAVLIGVVGFISHNNTITELNSRIETLKNKVETLESSVTSLKDSIKTQSIYIRALEDSISKLQGGLGRQSCLGLRGENSPNSLMTIRVQSGGIYSLRYNPIYTGQDFPAVNSAVKKYISTVSHTSLTSNAMINHAKRIDELTGEDCVFYIRLENGGVSKNDLILKWNELQGYLRLTNPSILQK